MVSDADASRIDTPGVLRAGGVEFRYTGQGSPWTESRCTVQDVHIDTPSQGLTTVSMKQPCFSILTNKPCAQNTSVPVVIENTGPQDFSVDLMSGGGQWYLDRPSATVIISPLPGVDLSTADVVMPVLEHLLARYESGRSVKKGGQRNLDRICASEHC